jgi:hypothetical protein
MPTMSLPTFLVNKSIPTVEILLNERVLELRDPFVQLPFNVFFGGKHSL